MHIIVEFYMGDRGVVIPQRVHFGARQIDVVETLDRWYGADYCYIKLRAPDNNVYIIRLDETLRPMGIDYVSARPRWTGYGLAPDDLACPAQSRK